MFLYRHARSPARESRWEMRVLTLPVGGVSPWWTRSTSSRPPVVRATASTSLREKPTYLRQESDEFLPVGFSPEGYRESDVQEELEFLLGAE